MGWLAGFFSLVLLAALTVSPGRAGDTARHRFEIPAGAAIGTLKRAAQKAGLEIV